MFGQMRLPGCLRGMDVQITLGAHSDGLRHVRIAVWTEGAWVTEGVYERLTPAEAADVVAASLETVWT